MGKLDPLMDASILRNLGIRDEEILSMILSTMLLKKAVSRNLTLASIAAMVQRHGDRSEPSRLERIVEKIMQQAAKAAPPTIADVPSTVITLHTSSGVAIASSPPVPDAHEQLESRLEQLFALTTCIIDEEIDQVIEDLKQQHKSSLLLSAS